MGKRVLVILGAGAVHDLIPPPSPPAAQHFASPNPDLHPPLTSRVFDDNNITKAILDKYQGARNLAGDIRTRLAAGMQLEPLLNEMYSAQAGPDAKQFTQIALYLQDYFAAISDGYTTQPINYNSLVRRLFNSDFEQIAFLTTNYDTILDKVLAPYYLDGPIKNLHSYIGQRCMLVKLHGSVDWARPIDHMRNDSLDTTAYLATLDDFGANLRYQLGGPLEWRPDYSRWSADGARCYYPALAVPLGHYEQNEVCPPQLINALTEFLPACNNVLVIGFSARDKDLLALLRRLPQVIHFSLVDKDSARINNALDAYQLFQASAATPGEGASRIRFSQGNLHKKGFSSFVLEGHLDEFIKTALS